MTDMRLFFALAALENKLVFGADVSNAFAEATAPEQVYYMRVDTQYREWWASKGHPPIPVGYVIPIRKNLQGHPEAPRQWSRHIDTIFQKYNFSPLFMLLASTVLQFPMKMCFSFDKLMTLPLQPMTCFIIPTSVMLCTANSLFL